MEPECDTKPVLIRRFMESDTPQLTSLWLNVFPDDPPWNAPAEIIRHKCAVAPDLFWVGVLGSRIVATVMAGYDGNRGWIYHLAVASDLRRNAFSRAMMVEAEARLRTLGCPKINLQVRASSADTVRFYQAIGYATEERISRGKRLD
jgi:ribosomal protein S18 acetylase RimI-like enzyme